ncbi:hypothetical protein RvY_15263 [Ramazzottius varieornatus]|uniref:Negative elongation factor E n=1 Tax=Ramazzottius varieornatus TaxID=947166 RepID=A0A1D1VU88_RAMVA|nr:hypothetical protein RvY_15263 [Ramazzottius varieornatus]
MVPLATVGYLMELPHVMTQAEIELKEIYAEYRELKDEAQKKKEAELGAGRKRGTDVVAEDSSELIKKLRNSGVLEKLKNDDTPKTQYKRASLLNRRLLNKPGEDAFTPTGSEPSTARPSPLPLSRPSSATPAQPRGNFSIPDRSMGTPPPSPFTDTPRPPNKPKNMFASFMKASKPEAETTAAASSQKPSEGTKSHPQSAYQPVQRQKMLFVEAENVTENFIKPIFEKYGALLRVTSVADKKHAFVLFKIWEHSQKALVDLDGKVVEGIALKVSEASRDPEKGPVEPRHSNTNHSFENPPHRRGDKRELVSYDDNLL